MGIEIYPSAAIPAQGLLRRRPGRDRVLAAIRDALVGSVDDPLLAKLVRASIHEHTLSIALHPCGPPLEFKWSPDGTIAAETKTSTVGPGYHAYCVDLLESVGASCGLRWNWADADETDYAVTRNFDRVRQLMISHLSALGRMLLDPQKTGEMENLAIHWPIDRPLPDGSEFTITPTGPRNRTWWRRLVEASPAEAETMAAGFYPWWGRERDERFWQGVLMALLWSEVPWHPPVDEAERQLCQTALACADRVRQLGCNPAPATAEVEELRQIVGRTPDDSRPPDARGAGFRRRIMRFRVSGDWSLKLPGYFYEREEEGTNVYWFGGRTVRLTTFTIRKQDGMSPSAEELLENQRSKTAPGADVVEWSDRHLRGHATIGLSEEEGKPFLMLQGCVATDGTMAIVTVCYEDASDRQWAESTFRSVQAPPPGEHPADEQ